jgi:hypothetical protein
VAQPIHDGATGGFTSYACFDLRRDFAAVAFLNAHPAFPFAAFLGEPIRQRLSREPALSLTPISVLPAGRIRSFVAYWITMLAAGSFMFCCRLGLKGFAALSCFPGDGFCQPDTPAPTPSTCLLARASPSVFYRTCGTTASIPIACFGSSTWSSLASR